MGLKQLKGIYSKWWKHFILGWTNPLGKYIKHWHNGSNQEVEKAAAFSALQEIRKDLPITVIHCNLQHWRHRKNKL